MTSDGIIKIGSRRLNAGASNHSCLGGQKRKYSKPRLSAQSRQKESVKLRWAKRKKQIEALATEIGQKENRQRELDRAIAQSNVYQEAERLEQQKAERVVEQKKLMDGCQKLALEIRREAGRINHICEKVMAWEKETLTPVQQAAENAKKAYTPFESAGPDLFARPISLFEQAQSATSDFWRSVRNTAHKVEDQVDAYKIEADQKKAALANLRKNVKDYPRD